MTIELDAKRLELLSELTPTVRIIGALINANRPGVEAEEYDLLAAAKNLSRELVVIRTDDGPSIETAFATLAKRNVAGILVGADALFNDHRQQVVSLAARYAMAGVYPWREYVTAGGLVSYGANLSEGYRLSGLYVGRISKEKSQPICLSFNQQNLSSQSTLEQPRRSVSMSRHRCSPAPTRSSNEKARVYRGARRRGGGPLVAHAQRAACR